MSEIQNYFSVLFVATGLLNLSKCVDTWINKSE